MRHAHCLTLAAGASFAIAGHASAQAFVNGNFETGDFTGWTVANTANGVGAPGSVIAFDIDGPGPLGSSFAPMFLVGQASFISGDQEGVELTQSLALTSGVQYTFDFDWAALNSINNSNGEGGVFSLIVNGVIVNSVAAGGTSSTTPHYGHLTTSYSPAASGPVPVGIRITRPFIVGGTVSEYVDNVTITGGGPTGACCIPAMLSCQQTTSATCAALSGAYNGDGSSCSTAGCPTPGACCLLDGTCIQTTPANCTAQPGIYRGDSSPCSSANCPQPPSGACCQLDGTCAPLTAAACANVVGLYSGDNTACASANCPHVYTYAGAPVAIIDAQCTATSTYAELAVADTFAIQQADAAFYVPHTYQGDLVFTLIHVDTGTSAVIVDRPGYPQTTFGFGSDNYGASAAVPFRTIDGAANVYDTPPVADPGIPNVSGLWKPQNALSIFNGESSAGTWRLLGQDCAGADTGTIMMFKLSLKAPVAACYANCDSSTQAPILNVADFTCFLKAYAAGDIHVQNQYANCDNSSQDPYLNVADFTCFLKAFAAGCP